MVNLSARTEAIVFQLRRELRIYRDESGHAMLSIDA